ncbi:MAG TPA: 50S ribosomal protein L4 [Candidatus Binatia bacterium]|nr:50S ribosomal protein L4 [Candidatus Binatia bacterium]
MPKVKLYSVEGKAVGEKELAPSVFGVAVNPHVVHEVMVGLAANGRQSLAHTKTKGEVRGGGKKPWKQKGTGRARQGSTRNPQWVGGGVAFGPRSERDYTKKINAKTKRKALCMALSDKVADEKLVLVESLGAKNGKTKEINTVLGKLPVKGKLMLVAAGKDEMLARSTRNLKNVNLVNVGSVNMNDIIRAEYVVTTPEATDKLEKMYAAKA